uniref:VapE domain-containing protein n=1 Tax=Cyanobium sp. TaxID=2164130 RepID=UPI0040484933
MAEQLALKALPSGWIVNNGKNTATTIKPGELSGLLTTTYRDRLAYNLLRHEVVIDRQPIQGSGVDNFYIPLAENGWSINKAAASDTLIWAAQRNSHHPVVDYLHRIEADPSIAPGDIDTLATDYLGTTDSLYDAMVAATLIGAIARALQPGCKFDTCCTLKGAQGIRKSSFWKALATPEWFCDSWQDRPQDLFMAIQTCWFYEIAELDSLTSKKEAGVLKALLSSDTDTFRPPYAKGIGRYPRPSVLVGTCNRDDFLNDPTGSRRFWIIDLPHDPAKGEALDINRVAKDRDSIIKAALAAYRNGRSRCLTKAQQDASNQRNLGFEAEHPFMARLADWTDKPANQFPFTTDQALSGSACRSSEQIRGNDLKDAAQCLKALGFIQDATQTRRKGQGRVRYWRRASGDSDDSGANQIPEAG